MGPGSPLWLGIELGERLQVLAGVAEVPHGPGLARGLVRRGGVEDVEDGAGAGAGDHAPAGAVPLLDQRLIDKVAGGGEPDRPDVGAGDDGGSFQPVVGAGARAGYHAPAGAVPVLDERLG